MANCCLFYLMSIFVESAFVLFAAPIAIINHLALVFTNNEFATFLINLTSGNIFQLLVGQLNPSFVTISLHIRCIFIVWFTNI